MTAPAPHDDGFALVEVTVAFAILAMTLIVTFQVFQEGLRRIGEAEDLARQIAVARSVLTEAELDPSLAPGIRTGETGGIAWRLTISAIAQTGQWHPLKLEVQTSRGPIADTAPPVLETIVVAP
jgi:type II secretory pathway pseudopilin PulG